MSGDRVAERYLDKLLGEKAEKPTFALSDQDQVAMYLRLNTDGWKRIVANLGPDGARDYFHDMESKRRRYGL